MRRVLSIWLPQLPLDLRYRKDDPRVAECFAIISEIKNAWRLTHLSEGAMTAGLSAGLSLPDARAKPLCCVRFGAGRIVCRRGLRWTRLMACSWTSQAARICLAVSRLWRLIRANG